MSQLNLRMQEQFSLGIWSNNRGLLRRDRPKEESSTNPLFLSTISLRGGFAANEVVLVRALAPVDVYDGGSALTVTESLHAVIENAKWP